VEVKDTGWRALLEEQGLHIEVVSAPSDYSAD
jgi:hypothetical protein